jgi:hypothetical protein
MFVQREQDKLSPRFGKVKGLYVVKQPGYAEEELAASHADVVEFTAHLASFSVAKPTLAEILVKKGVLTPLDIAPLK